jgi:hypothetical protein
MQKLKLGPISDDKPVKLTIELPASVHRDLVAYAEALSRETGKPVGAPAKLIVPMIERFMATDRGFVKARRSSDTGRPAPTSSNAR